VGRLKPLRFREAGLVAILAFVAIGCGPTASVITTVGPGPGDGRSSAIPRPTADARPGASSEPGSSTEPGPTDALPTPGEPTPIPLSSPTPFSGAVWQPLPDFPSGNAFEVTGVTAFGAGFTAVGFQQVPGEDFFGRRQGVVWQSDDGRAWQSTVHPIFQFVTPEEIVALGDSLFVFGTIEVCDLSLGDECVEPPEAGWAVWRSTAGGAWERLPQHAQMQAGTIDGVVAANAMLIAYGWAGDNAQSVVWTSSDGVNWASTTDVVEMDPVTAMTGADVGLVAFGTRLASEAVDLELVAAVSVDGSRFAQVGTPALPAATVQSVTSGPLGLVAVGDADDLNLGFTGITLYSADGLSWTQTAAVDGSFVNSSIMSVHALPHGYVALGLVPLLDEFGIATGVSWMSRDGQGWQTLAPLGDRFSQLAASAVGPAGIVAFTVTEEDPDDETVVSTISAWFAPIEALSLP